jgi:hypothetical protein
VPFTIGNVSVNDSVPSQTVSRVNPLDRLWRILASPRLTVVLLVWVAVALAIDTVIPQAPPQVADPIVRSQWLATLPIGIRPAIERLYSFGLFGFLDLFWLRLPLALLLAHALVVLADRGPAIWHRLRRPSREVDSFGKSFQLERDWPQPAEPARLYLLGRLERASYHIFSTQNDEAPQEERQKFIAQRWRWSWLGLAGLYLGLALSSAGLILAGWLGEVQELNLAPDDPTPLTVGATSGPSLVLQTVEASGADPLRPANGLVVVRHSSGVGESQDLVLRLNTGRVWRGRWVTLAELRPMAEVTVEEVETGQSLLLQPFLPRSSAQERVRLPLTGNPDARFVSVPSPNVTLHVDYQDHEGPVQRNGQYPAFSVSFYRGAESTPSQIDSLRDGQTVEADGLRYTVTFGYDATLRVNSTLWWILVALGWAVTATSIIALVLASPVYARISVESDGEGSRVSLMVDTIGDEGRRHRELRALVTPDV